MISFTVKGKNFHPRASYWWPSVYYYENGDIKYAKASDAINIISISQTTVHFNNVPSNSGFGVGFYTSPNIADIITDPMMAATTDLFVLENSKAYVLDFHNEIAIPTLLEEEVPPEEEFPVWEKGAAMFLPWSPLFGPPLPKGLFPPWPMWMTRWTEIPGYPKVPS